MRAGKTAARVQAALERYYRLEHVAPVEAFLREADADARETVRIRECEGDVLEIEVCAPSLPDPPTLDALCQLIEGVSHFVYLAERSRTALPATQLELELQAEVDKFVVLAWLGPPTDVTRMRELHERLYERVLWLHPACSEEGARYRLANDLAARFVERLQARYVARGRLRELRAALSRFYRK